MRQSSLVILVVNTILELEAEATSLKTEIAELKLKVDANPSCKKPGDAV